MDTGNIEIGLNTPDEAQQNSYPGYELHEGCNGEGVGKIKAMLNKIRGKYHNIPLITVASNIFDAETAAAVKAFQQSFNLIADSIAGKTTWNKIEQVYNRLMKLDKPADKAAAPAEGAGTRAPHYNSVWGAFEFSEDDMPDKDAGKDDADLSESWLQPMFYENDYTGGSAAPAVGSGIGGAVTAGAGSGAGLPAAAGPDSGAGVPAAAGADIGAGKSVTPAAVSVKPPADVYTYVKPQTAPVKIPAQERTAAAAGKGLCKPCQAVRGEYVQAAEAYRQPDKLIEKIPDKLYYYENYHPYPVVMDYTAPVVAQAPAAAQAPAVAQANTAIAPNYRAINIPDSLVYLMLLRMIFMCR